MNRLRARSILWALGFVTGSMGIAFGTEQPLQKGPITVVQQKGAQREDFPLTMNTDEVSLGFRAVWSPDRRDDGAGFGAVRGSTMDRIITDASAGLFFGYRLTAKLTHDKRVRIEFGPLPPDFQLGNHLAEACPHCPPFTPLGAALVRYPEPQVVEDGGAFTFEMLRNPKTGETLSDFVRIHVLKPEERLAEPVKRVTPTAAPSERFRVDLALRWDTANPETLLADVHIFDLRTGKEMQKALIPLARPEDSAQLRFGGMSPTNAPLLDVYLQVQASRSGGTVVYTLDVREGADLVHAEKVSLPYPKR